MYEVDGWVFDYSPSAGRVCAYGTTLVQNDRGLDTRTSGVNVTQGVTLHSPARKRLPAATSLPLKEMESWTEGSNVEGIRGEGSSPALERDAIRVEVSI